MNTGPKIDNFRKTHDITIKSLIENIMNQSTYHRYSNNENIIRADNFFALVHRLRLSFFEISTIDRTDVLTMNQLKLDVQTAIKNKDKTQLNRYRYSLKNSSTKLFDTYHTLYITVEKAIADIEQRPLSDEILLPLTEYLLHVDTWNFLEMHLLNLTIDYHSTDYICLFLNQCLERFTEYHAPYRNANLVLLLNAVISELLLREEVQLAKHYLDQCSLYIQMVGRSIVKYYYTLNEVMVNYTIDPSEANLQAIYDMHLLNQMVTNVALQDKTVNYYKKLQPIYNWPEWEEQREFKKSTI